MLEEQDKLSLACAALDGDQAVVRRRDRFGDEAIQLVDQVVDGGG